jgi:hypothetical protein
MTLPDLPDGMVRCWHEFLRKRAARTATFLNVQASVFLHHNEDGDADDAPGGSEETC